METKDLSAINYASYNPRTLSRHDGESLKNSLTTFGDLGAIVENEQTNTLVCGHQRLRTLDNKFPGRVKIRLEQKSETPDEYGTIGTGHVIVEGTNLALPYRLVSWNLAVEKAANIASNRISASWDKDALAQINHELSQLENGSELLSLTGQTDEELERLNQMIGIGDENPEDAPKESDSLSFKVSPEERDTIEEAIRNITATREIATNDRSSKNGTALYHMSRDYLDRLHDAQEN